MGRSGGKWNHRSRVVKWLKQLQLISLQIIQNIQSTYSNRFQFWLVCLSFIQEWNSLWFTRFITTSRHDRHNSRRRRFSLSISDLRLHFEWKLKVNNIQYPIWIVQWNIPIDATANNSVDINDNDIVDPTQSNFNCQWLGRWIPRLHFELIPFWTKVKKKNDSMVIEGRLHFVLKQKVNNIQHPIWIVQWNIPIDATANNSVDINDNDIVDPTQSNYNCQWLGRFLFEQK